MRRYSLFSIYLFGVAAGARAQTTRDMPLVDQLSVIGTIRGGDSPTLRDTVVLLDVVTGKTEVLAKGGCLERLPTVCVRLIQDKTILVGQRGEDPIEIGHIEGEAPHGATSTYAGSSGSYGGAGGSYGGATSSWDSIQPPPPPPPPPAWMVNDADEMTWPH